MKRVEVVVMTGDCKGTIIRMPEEEFYRIMKKGEQQNNGRPDVVVAVREEK